MKVKKIVLMSIIFALLIGGGIWFGIHLTQKNSQSVLAIAVLSGREQKVDLMLTTNRKDKIVSVRILNDDLKYDFKTQKIVGENVGEFFKVYVQSYDCDDCKIEIFGTEHNRVLKTKRAIKKQFENEKIDVDFEVNTSLTNCQNKYKKIAEKMQIEDNFENKKESEILKIFVKNSQKAKKKAKIDGFF